jgi:hypothetical protein
MGVGGTRVAGCRGGRVGWLRASVTLNPVDAHTAFAAFGDAAQAQMVCPVALALAGTTAVETKKLFELAENVPI